MFKKPKRNFRSRKAQDENSDADGDDNGEKMEIAGETYIVQETAAEDDPVTVKKKKKKKSDKEKEKSSQKTASVLSFNDEEEAETDVFKIKRSSHSRRVAKQLKKQTQQEKDLEREMKAKKRELVYQRQKQQQQNSATNGSAGDSGNGSAGEGAPEGAPEGDDMELGSDFDPDEDLVKPEVDEEDEVDEDAERRRAFQNILESGVIPDAKMIHEARKRRQQARELGDFVPLDDTVKVEKTSSRLVREDDNDKSDSDEEPVSFSVNHREKELRSIQSTILAAQEDSDNDQEKEWEEQQIRKGRSMPQLQDKPGEQPEYYDGYQQYLYGTQSHSIFNPTGPQYSADAYLGASGAPGAAGPLAPTDLGKRHGLQPTGELPQVTIEQVKKRLKDRLDTMVSVHRAHVHERDDLASRQEMSETSIEKCTGSKGDMEEQYQFFQEMRGYVRDLVECLNEKVPQINYLERRIVQIEKSRADYITKRRQEDIKDQSADLMSSKAAAAPNLSGVDSPSAQQQDHHKQRRIAEREARRSRRRRKREWSNAKGHNEGMSTDDEENNSIIAKYKLEIETITNSCDTMFEDVMEDFHEVDLIKSRFEDWRTKQSESYNEAYIGLCLPKLFTPVVKLGLITWNPLQENAEKLENTKWFESLMFYSFHMGDERVRHDDQDVKLVPSIVEKVVLPKLAALIEQVWEPLSTKQTKRLVTTIQGLICDYPTVSAESKHMQALVRAVVTRVRKTLDDDVFMPLYSKDVLTNKGCGQYQFFQRQFWTSVKLFDNMLSWHGILSDRVLRELALDGLLNRYVMLALCNSPPGMETVQKCSVICNAFPSAWFSERHEMSTIPQLENLCKYMVRMAESLEKTKTEANKREVRETVKQITKLLVNVHALDHASSLTKS